MEHDQAPLPVQHPPPPTTGKVPCALGVNGGWQEQFPSLSSCGGPGSGSQGVQVVMTSHVKEIKFPPSPAPAGQDVLRKGGAHVRDIISSLIPPNRNGGADS